MAQLEMGYLTGTHTVNVRQLLYAAAVYHWFSFALSFPSEFGKKGYLKTNLHLDNLQATANTDSFVKSFKLICVSSVDTEKVTQTLPQ